MVVLDFRQRKKRGRQQRQDVPVNPEGDRAQQSVAAALNRNGKQRDQRRVTPTHA